MGRYYSGDIEGKFMFAVQSSDAPERFGAIENQDYIDYWIDSDSIDESVQSLEHIHRRDKRYGR